MSPSRWRSVLITLAFAALIAGCEGTPAGVGETPPVPPSVAADSRLEGHDLARNASPTRRHRAWLRQLRRTTAPFRRFRVAKRAGYDAQLTACQVTDAGGMGFHYGNPSLIDGVVEEQKPEVLLYEPTRRGELRLVAVEYIVPFTAWTNDDPPELNGVAFHRNHTFGLWVLHAWVWKRNPTGVFQDWNPRVNCRFAN